MRNTFEQNNQKLLTQEQGNALENALDKVKEKDSGARVDISPEHGITLHTSNLDVPLHMTTDGKWQVAGFEKAAFDNPEHALRVAAVTAFIINHFTGKQTREKAFTVSNR